MYIEIANDDEHLPDPEDQQMDSFCGPRFTREVDMFLTLLAQFRDFAEDCFKIVLAEIGSQVGAVEQCLHFQGHDFQVQNVDEAKEGEKAQDTEQAADHRTNGDPHYNCVPESEMGDLAI